MPDVDSRARSLLLAAAEMYDSSPELRVLAVRSWRGAFNGGAEWMRHAIGLIRQAPLPQTSSRFSRLGVIKYALASIAAIGWVACCVAIGWPWLAIVAALVFYAVEAQMVFLFPLALDGRRRPFQQSLRWTRRAGGTVRVVTTVIPLAAVMLLGGCVGRGFVRSWSIGCLAVCIWYERLRTRVPRPRIAVRYEQIAGWNLDRPVRILYASDLHLGRRWTRCVPSQLVTAARAAKADVILLGGDLVDCAAGLKSLSRCVKSLCRLAPLYAIAGNHDRRAGVAAVRSGVETAGGVWLGDGATIDGLPFDCCDASTLRATAGSTRRLLIAHEPSIFPTAADANIDLVLAGHLHGGQCVLAQWRGRMYPGAWWSRWTGLRFQRGRSTMLVSRGVADTLPLRWNCPREVILCEIS